LLVQPKILKSAEDMNRGGAAAGTKLGLLNEKRHAAFPISIPSTRQRRARANLGRHRDHQAQHRNCQSIYA
jgi:hypothetical protein